MATSQTVVAQVGPLRPRAPEPIVGVVTDADGKPAAGVDVYFVGWPVQPVDSTRSIVARTRSDQSGQFHHSPGQNVITSVVAYRPGCRLDGLDLSTPTKLAPGEPLRFVLRPERIARFRVLDPGGAPVTGARIQLSSLRLIRNGSRHHVSLPAELTDQFAVVTGADGNAALPGADPEEIEAVTVTAAGFGTQDTFWNSRSADARTIKLLPVGRLVGRIVADNPKQLGGVFISSISRVISPIGALGEAEVRPRGKIQTKSDETGRFDVPALAQGRFYILARISPTSSYCIMPFKRDLEIVAGGTTEVEIPLSRGIKVRGSVREKRSGRPLAGASVRLIATNERTSRTVLTDDEGQYTAYILPGPLTARVLDSAPYRLPSGVAGPSITVSKDAKEAEIPPIEVVRGGDVQGAVVDDEGKPVADALVEASWVDRSLEPARVTRSSATTNGQGEYLLRDLPSATVIRLTARFEDACSAPPVTTKAGAPGPVRLRVSRANTMALGGRVVDEFGKPIAGASVWIYSRSWTPDGFEDLRLRDTFGELAWTIRTNADGRFETPRLLRRDERHYAMASVPGGRDGRTDWLAPTTPSFFDVVLYPVPPPEEATVRAIYDAGSTELNRGNYEAAAKQFRKALDEAERLQIKDSLAMGFWLNGLATALNGSGKNFDAEPFARRALELREKALPPDHPAIADSVSQLAQIYDETGRYDEGEKLHRRAIALRENVLAKDHPGYAWSLYLFARHYTSCAQRALAEPLFRKALEIQEKVYGPEELLVGYTVRDMAINATALSKYGEDEALYQRALRIGEKSLGARAPFVAYVLEQYAARLRKTGREPEAEKLEARAKKIRSTK